MNKLFNYEIRIEFPQRCWLVMILIWLFVFCYTEEAMTQETTFTQTIRGWVIDIDSKAPLIGASVILGEVASTKGTITDDKGYFLLEKVPVGRHDVRFSYLGYEPEIMLGLLVSSGKEVNLQIEMEESVIGLSEIRIVPDNKRSKTINDIISVSGRSFSAVEIENYPGSMSDISRTALSFPGVMSTNDGKNHIVIRGNSPKGLQWRLEGIEIPNLNHFSNIGSSGGGVGIISNNMLATSDFITSAFPAEYGNALSGVFDLRLRTGNNNNHERTVQVGMIGTELMLEGPLKKNSNSTYIAHYRYSTFKLIKLLGANLTNLPDFQDLTFKIYHPTNKLGVFSIFGIGGLSKEVGNSGYIMKSNMGVAGVSNSFTLNRNTNIKTIFALSGLMYSWDDEYNMGTTENPIDRINETKVIDYTVKASTTINKKISAKHKLKFGLLYEQAFNDSYIGWYSDTLFSWNQNPLNPGFQVTQYQYINVDSRYETGTFQTFVNWKYRIKEGLSLNSGVHYLHFFLNNSNSLEPRLGLDWEIHPQHIVSAGFGVHSRKESLTLYAGKKILEDGTVIQPNKNLDLSKARHYVIGYHYLISEHLNLKAEVYYQSLYDIPAFAYPPYLSSVNFDYGFEDDMLENYGTAYNKGVELTLDKQLAGGFHFLFSGTIYDSKYIDKLGQTMNTKYDGGYGSNGILAKEFKLGKHRQNILSVSTRYLLIGGMRNLPIDKESSVENGYQVLIWDQGYSEKSSDYFRIDLQLRFIMNKQNHTSEWSLEVMNLTNRKNLLYEYWDRNLGDFKQEFQNPIIPLIKYRIQF